MILSRGKVVILISFKSLDLLLIKIGLGGWMLIMFGDGIISRDRLFNWGYKIFGRDLIGVLC